MLKPIARHKNLRFLLAPFLIATLAGSPALAGLSGYVETSYSLLDTKSKAADGSDSTLETRSFGQRYSGLLGVSPFPNVRLMSGALFQMNDSDTNTNGTSTESSAKVTRPFAELTLSNGLLNSAVGYSRRDEDLKFSGQRGTSQTNEDYRALLGWKPVGLPWVDLQFRRSATHDGDRAAVDNVDDKVTLGLRYMPVQDLDLRYQGLYSDAKDKVSGLETRGMSHTARATYFRQLLRKRISLYTSYDANIQNVSTVTLGKGTVTFPIFSFMGLSGLTDTPVIGDLDQNNALIDGNLTAGSGLSIGVVQVGDNGARRNFGIDFFNPTEISRLFVWVDRELPSSLASAFVWDIYASDDASAGDNQNWTHVATIANAPFGPFQNRFQLDFPPVKARFIKVAVLPLTPFAAALAPAFQDPDRIFVTELQGFLTKPAEDAQRDIRTFSQIYTLTTKVKLLDSPSLFYDFSLYLANSEPAGFTRYVFSNGLNASHRFNDIFSMEGRVAREDMQDSRGRRTAYASNVSLRAVPYRTLSHTLVYSGRFEDAAAGWNTINSLSLFNTAELYPGIHLNFSGGTSFITADTGEKDRAVNFLAGTSIIPHRTLNMNLTYSYNQVNRAIGDFRSTTSNQRGDLSATFRPFPALYLFGSLGVVEQQDKTQLLQNYGFNFSPFPDGLLQLNLAYNESISTEKNAKQRMLAPSVTWRVTSKSLLELAYLVMRTESTLEKSDTRVFNGNFKFFF